MSEKQNTRKQDAFDLEHVQNVRAVALFYGGGFAGRIVANWGKSRRCTATVAIWAGPLATMPKTTKTAGGYGYDKLASCLEQALPDAPDGGTSAVYRWLEQTHGYTVAEVI